MGLLVLALMSVWNGNINHLNLFLLESPTMAMPAENEDWLLCVVVSEEIQTNSIGR